MGDLGDRAKKRQERVTSIKKEESVIDFFTKSHGSGDKDRAISARVNGTTYQKFKSICKTKGLTPNACINMLISQYVFDNRQYIDE